MAASESLAAMAAGTRALSQRVHIAAPAAARCFIAASGARRAACASARLSLCIAARATRHGVLRRMALLWRHVAYHAWRWRYGMRNIT